jgi:hypothetical protein
MVVTLVRVRITSPISLSRRTIVSLSCGLHRAMTCQPRAAMI